MAEPRENITTLPVESRSKFDQRGRARPMLSRDADAMYWMCRYVERAEHVARLLMINASTLIDVGDLETDALNKLWLSILRVFRIEHPPPSDLPLAEAISRYMTFEIANPNSIVSCLTRARENARSIRENISAEMWEALNSSYLSVRADDAVARFDESREDFYRSVLASSMLFQGLTNQTLPHTQRWQFAQVAKYFERIDVTSRILDTRWSLLASGELTIEPQLRNIHWMGVLRSCCSIETFRREYPGEMDPLRIAQFLILRNDFPRSIRFCVEQASESLTSLRTMTSRAIDPAERIVGRLLAQLDYAELAEVLNVGISRYLQNIQHQISEAATAVQKAYFLY
ncbi:MAG TPA: alpha-E domain-containing protein [Tepidisphaeraceae bacterium]|nr:alpha-E domain-containing protein [Tepidisphaeraceae bacterium]